MNKVIHPITFKEYRQSEGVAQSTLKHFRKSPLHVWHSLNEPQSPPSPNMILGSITESIVFGTPFNYTTSPFDNFRTDKARDWRDAQRAAGIEVVSQETVEQARSMALAVKQCDACRELLRSGRTQVAVYADYNTVTRKGLIDWVPNGLLALVDLKTTGTGADKDSFASSIWNFGYHVQAAYYTDIWAANHLSEQPRQFVFIVVESDPPYGVGVYALDDASMALGRATYIKWLDRFEKCAAANVWPGYGDGQMEFIDLPKWAQMRMVE